MGAAKRQSLVTQPYRNLTTTVMDSRGEPEPTHLMLPSSSTVTVTDSVKFSWPLCWVTAAVAHAFSSSAKHGGTQLTIPAQSQSDGKESNPGVSSPSAVLSGGDVEMKDSESRIVRTNIRLRDATEFGRLIHDSVKRELIARTLPSPEEHTPLPVPSRLPNAEVIDVDTPLSMGSTRSRAKTVDSINLKGGSSPDQSSVAQTNLLVSRPPNKVLTFEDSRSPLAPLVVQKRTVPRGSLGTHMRRVSAEDAARLAAKARALPPPDAHTPVGSPSRNQSTENAKAIQASPTSPKLMNNMSPPRVPSKGDGKKRVVPGKALHSASAPMPSSSSRPPNQTPLRPNRRTSLVVRRQQPIIINGDDCTRYIPSDLEPSAQAKLRELMKKELSTYDYAGYLYMLEVHNAVGIGNNQICVKIGQSFDPADRVTRQAKSCGWDITLHAIFPFHGTGLERGDTRTKWALRLEALVHTELLARSLGRHQDCGCGVEHREVFIVRQDPSNNFTWKENVLEIIERWGEFVERLKRP